MWTIRWHDFVLICRLHVSEPVSVRRRCAAQGCTNARTDAHSAGGGGDDQVDVGFGQDSGIYRGFTRDLQGIGELIRSLQMIPRQFRV